MDDEKVVQLHDGDHLEFQTTVVWSDPEQALLKLVIAWHRDRLAVIHHVQGPRLPDPVSPG
jgi:hypothetical protein